MDYIAYLSKEEIKSFIEAKEASISGFAYEWEGEQVVHIHTHPLLHAFGLTSKALFVKDSYPKELPSDFRFLVVVKSLEEVKLYLNLEGTLTSLEAQFIPRRQELYSRSQGLLEVDILAQKHVGIVGLGSFGSQIALELAKAGVGEFSLFDFDRLELHNLARHFCTLKDLGRLKTEAISEAILGKNPYALVHKYPLDITKDPKTLETVLKKLHLLIVATDNNASRFMISSLLYEQKKVGIFGRAITRAAGGDVFRYRPNGPCYGCLIGSHLLETLDEEISSEASGRRSGQIPAYASAKDIDTLVQVGLAIDIEPICNLMLKLALVELSLGEASGISSLEEDLKYDAYIWANRRDKNFAHWHPFYQAGAKQTILRWYGLKFPRDEHCPICSSNLKLDVGTENPDFNYDEYSHINFNLD